ncbi:MAG: MarR family winged helix-turn-helix transcriptional regulator [Acidimicrobiales bacterium]
MATTDTRAADPAVPAGGRSRRAAACRVSAGLERSLTQVARAILRLEVPKDALAEGESIDRAGYWLLVRLSGQTPVRLSELAESVELDLSTVSRQMRDLVACGLVAKVPDPQDGRASLLSLSRRGKAVLDAVSEARRQALAEAVADWTEDERDALAAGLARLEAGLHHTRDHRAGGPLTVDARA